MSNINPALASLHVSIDALHEDPKNARRHPPRNLEAIKASLNEFGQQKPIIVLVDGTIVAGNGTFRAAVSLGWPHLAAVAFDGSLKDARKYAIADNRTGELAEWDVGALQAEMHDLGEAEWEATGWTSDELRDTAGHLPSAGTLTGDGGPGALSGADAETGRTPTDKLDTFMNNALRQIVLIYPAADHGRVVAALEQVQQDQSLKSNTEAVDWLLAQYAAARTPEES